MKLMLFATLFLLSCRTSSPTSDTMDVADIAKMDATNDGSFDVICKNGKKEHVSAEKIKTGKVCEKDGTKWDWKNATLRIDLNTRDAFCFNEIVDGKNVFSRSIMFNGENSECMYTEKSKTREGLADFPASLENNRAMKCDLQFHREVTFLYPVGNCAQDKPYCRSFSTSLGFEAGFDCMKKDYQYPDNLDWLMSAFKTRSANVKVVK